MPRLSTWQCSCGRYAPMECDWPTEVAGIFCNKPICNGCVRRDGDKEYCPYHRGDVPKPAAEEAQRLLDAENQGRIEAENAARMFGLK